MVVVTGEAEAAGLTAAEVVADFMEAGEQEADFTAEAAAVARLIIPVADRMVVLEDTVVRVECRDTAAGRMDDPEVMVRRVGFRDTAVGPPVWAEREQEQVRQRAAALAVRRRAAVE
jgi:hypothetical protein